MATIIENFSNYRWLSSTFYPKITTLQCSSNSPTMTTFFGSPSLSHPLHRTTLPPHLSSSASQTPPPPPPPAETPPPQPSLRATSSEQKPLESVNLQQNKSIKKPPSNTKADSTDWIASTLTRRFGLGAGLAWAGFLAFGVVSEQIKTRLEVSQQESNTRDVEKEQEVILPNGIKYYELRVGGGSSPIPGDLVVIDLKGNIEGRSDVFVDTFDGDVKPLALVLGSRPYTKGMCEGIEYVLKSMKAGGKRRVIIPSSLGFGEKGAELGSGVQIPPFATLEYIVQVDKVSIAPA